MITLIPSAQRHQQDFGWLQTRWHFSFGDYHDPANLNWGPLRVFNDDLVQPRQGFARHPHRDMEIITYVIDGQLEHGDNLGNRGVISAGEIQIMSAGRGIIHSEQNPSPDAPVRFLQLWILPRTRGLSPRWAQRRFTRAQRGGRLLRVVAPAGAPGAAGAMTIDQDASVYVAALAAGQGARHASAAGRKAYLFVIDGALTVKGRPLRAGDQARIADEPELAIQATHDSELIFLDLPDEP
jgi:redox-sensitive bicupin YhaK (pirin superfamily)